ncbi:MAG: SRPBCC family protein [Stellaceae bacterium]
MISIREQITIASPPEAVWPLLSDPAVVASCIPGATLTKADENGAYQGTMRVKFGPTVAQFRGEAKLAYDHPARRCSIEGRGIDGRGASRANASGAIEASGTDTTLLRVEGNFNVTGPLETFANAGGVHLARAILAEFAENVARLMAEQTIGATGEAAPLAAAAATGRAPPPESLPLQAERGAAERAKTASRPAAAELSGGKILWRILVSWLRQVFSGKREAR